MFKCDPEKGIHDFEKERESFVADTVKDAISKLTDTERKELLEHPDPIEHHFGYGMYIRNHYIHGKELKFPIFSADDLSEEIVEGIIKMLKQEEAGEN